MMVCGEPGLRYTRAAFFLSDRASLTAGHRCSPLIVDASVLCGFINHRQRIAIELQWASVWDSNRDCGAYLLYTDSLIVE